MPSNNYHGAYRTMAEGVNSMVKGTSLLRRRRWRALPSSVAGISDAPLDRFPGKKAFINDTIEQVRTNHAGPTADTQSLVAAAVAGRLKTQADVSP